MTHMELTWNRGPNLIVRVSMKDDDADARGGCDVNGNNEAIADKDDGEEEDEDNLRKGRL